MVKPKREKTMKIEEVTQQFERCIIKELSKKKDIEGIKRYIKKYFFKCYDPNVTFIYDPIEKRFRQVKNYEVNESCFQGITIKSTEENDGDEITKTFKLSKWFYEDDTDYYRIILSVNDPKIFSVNDVKYINHFTGFIHNRKSYESYSNETKEAVDSIIEHIKNIWCSKNESVYKYVMSWFSCALTGKRKMKSLLYLKSIQGTGKSIMTEFIYKKVVGEKLCCIDTDKSVLEEWNHYLAGKILLVMEELPTDSINEWKSVTGRLKNFITGVNLKIKQKNKDDYFIKNCISGIVNSNYDALKISFDDRRIAMLDVSEDKIGKKEYFNDLTRKMEIDDVGEAFFNYLCEYYENNGGKDFNDAAIPQTEAKKNMIIENLASFYKFLKEEYVMGGHDLNTTLNLLYDEYKNYAGFKVESKTAISKDLRRLGIELKDGKDKDKRHVKIIYVEAQELRRIFENKGWIADTDEIIVDDDDSTLQDADDVVNELKKIKSSKTTKNTKSKKEEIFEEDKPVVKDDDSESEDNDDDEIEDMANKTDELIEKIENGEIKKVSVHDYNINPVVELS